MTNKGPRDGQGVDTDNDCVSSTKSARTGVIWTGTARVARVYWRKVFVTMVLFPFFGS